MEDVLEVYHRPHDPEYPVVCVDETSKQLISETRVPIKLKPGQPARQDYEYERNGTVNLFMMFAPLEGWRHVAVTDRHTAVDFAHILKDLSDIHFPAAKRIVLMEDNLNTHKPESLYEAFPAAEARRLVERFRDGASTTHRNTAVGSIWPKPSSACCRVNVSIAGSPTSSTSSRRSPPGRIAATTSMSEQIGNSPPPTPASS